jgi:nicotinamidase-related amidase
MSLPLPPHYQPEKVSQVYRVPYQERAVEARAWANQHQISAASQDQRRTALLLIDVQNTFCLPEFELFVGGSSGNGAVEDNQRLCEFIYRNLGGLTQIICTMDTHRAAQVFHPLYLIDPDSQHPAPHTQVTHQEILDGRWRFNPAIAASLGMQPDYAQRWLEHYTAELSRLGKYALTIWPYHAMLGGIGHALVPAVEEAVFYHTIARNSQAQFEIKGEYDATENYSVIGPEVLTGPDGERVAEKNPRFLDLVRDFDALFIAGQAKSHCVAWTVADLLEQIHSVDPTLARKVYLLEDCTSPVVVPGVIDFSQQADEAYARFASAGMNRIRSDFQLSLP